jgi:hypothetical protein
MKTKFRFKDDSYPGAGDGTPIIASSFNPLVERIERLEYYKTALFILLALNLIGDILFWFGM